MTRVVILHYGVGNLHSLAKAIEEPGVTVDIASEPGVALSGDALVLPGVGNFGAAVDALSPAMSDLRRAIAAGHPTLGICLGMQLLFERSDEASGDGIAAIQGCVRRLRSPRVPQIGWNTVEPAATSSDAFDELKDVYYANSYVCSPVDTGIVTAWSEHDGDRFPAAIRFARTAGVQFHPEKSSREGVRFLRQTLREITR